MLNKIIINKIMMNKIINKIIMNKMKNDDFETNYIVGIGCSRNQ